MTVTRVTNMMVSRDILAQINQAQDTMDNTEQELSTGLKINQPSDNPYGAALAVQLNGRLAQLTGYASNITDGTSWAQAATAGMTTIQSEAQRAQELVVEASNGTNSQSDLNNIAAEIKQIIGAVKSAANSQYDGQYIFSGSATTTQPYSTTYGDDAYAGNAGSVTRQIGPASSVAVNADLSSVLGQGASAGDGGLLDTLETVYTDLTSGNRSALSSTALTNLQTNLSALTTAQTQIGAVQDQLTLASSSIASMQTTLTSELSDDQDANMAATMTAYSSEQAAFTAALKAGASIIQTSLMDFLN